MDDYGAGFAEHIHQYNNAFAFTSLGVKVDQSVLNSLGLYAFKIMGELSHLSGSLLPVAGTDLVFAQIYVYDEAEAQAIRMGSNGHLRHSVNPCCCVTMTTYPKWPEIMAALIMSWERQWPRSRPLNSRSGGFLTCT